MRTIGLSLVVALIAAACSTSEPAPSTAVPPGNTTPATTASTAGDGTSTPPTTIARPDGSEEATVVTVFDGDSILVDINGRREEVRLLAINAPERGECFGSDAGDRLRELAGSTVWLIADGEDTDRFGRLLRLVFTPTSFVNADLVEGGYALGLQDGTTLSTRLKTLEDIAFRDAAGMWGWDVCGATLGNLEISDLQPNAPGPDDENLVEEWIEFTNLATVPTDMGGFIVRDESSAHRYSFPPGFVLDAGAVVRLHTGCGQDTQQNIYWCSETSVWTNGGDTVLLQTPGGTVIDRLVYTDS